MQIPYYICGGHDHTGLPWMGECIAQNKITGVSKIKKIDKITNKEIEKKEYILMDNFDKKNPFYIQPPYFKNLFKKYLNRDGMKDFEIVGTKCQHPYHEACKITLAQEFPNFDGYVKYGTEHEKN